MGGRRKLRGFGDICICIADSLCYIAETNTPLSSNYTPIKMLKKINHINKIDENYIIISIDAKKALLNFDSTSTYD